MIKFPFELFYGVVEDIDDPEKAGRVRVRCYAIHTDNKTLIPTEKLPWATVGRSTDSAAVSGIGSSPHGLVNGSEIIGFFRDGENCQDPVVMMSVGGFPTTTPNINKGFSDPSGEYPRYIDEPDVNRLARNENINETVIDSRKNSVEKGVVSAAGVKWDEPITAYNAVYPNNRVVETKSGHVIEIDDSEGAERIHLYHRSGSFTEFYPDGTTVKKCISNNYEIVHKDANMLVRGNLNITSNNNINVKCKDATVECDNATVECKKSLVKAVEEYIVETKLFKVVASTKALFETPMVEGTGDVQDKKATMQADRDIYNTHTHVETQTTTATPSQQQ